MNAQGVSARGCRGFTQKQNTDEQKQIEAALIELEHLRQINKLNKEQIAALNDKIKALEDLAALEHSRAESYKSADEERRSANSIDSRRVATLEQIISDYKQERERLIKERDNASRRSRWYLITGFIIGGLLGFLGAKN
jgi:hypothetical protein